jgi:hypothetical protein
MAMVEERPLFENEDWAVIESGLEHKRTGYFIERKELAQRRADGLWLWPLHVAEKNWCRMAPFMEAFSCAASVYGVDPDVDLARSFMAARRDVAEWPTAGGAAREPGLASAPQAAESAAPNRLPGRPRSHPARGLPRPAALSPWRAPRRIQRAGTTLVRLLQAAWNKK